MNARVALAWIEGEIVSSWLGEPDDLASWLACDDAAIVARASARKLATVRASGGEVG